MRKLLLSLQIVTILSAMFFWTNDAAAINQDQKCVACHSSLDIMQGLYKQYSSSAHYKNDVTCFDCHGASEKDADAFEHEGSLISIIVSPKDCAKCHKKAVEEFNASEHANARRLVTTGVGGYFLDNLAGSQHLGHAVKYAAGTSGCFACHGTKVIVDKMGRPTAETWPNSGIARENPDGSIGNCSACHERHDFSVAQARRPESCAFCHNDMGGAPQMEAYESSQHGVTYAAKSNQMNFDSSKWVVGKDYFTAPTCATCHMSATPDMPATHNLTERIHWNTALQESNAVAVQEKCGLPIPPSKNYEQPIPSDQHRNNMKNVCSACHGKVLIDQFMEQYEMEVDLIEDKWLKPGRELFQLATKVLKDAEDEYTFYTHPIDYIWFGMCNSSAKYAHTGAAMMSPGLTQKGNGGFAADWYSSYIPSIEGIIKKYSESEKMQVRKGVKNLQNKLDEIMKKNAYSGPWGVKETKAGK